MATIYTDIPRNFSEIEDFVITDVDRIAATMIRKQKCYFYDACSFRRHANLRTEEAEYFLKYVQMQDGIIIITRGVLMELASHSGILNPEYVQYMKQMQDLGLELLLLYEEDLFSVLEICFSTNAAINSYLSWAVRMITGPVSTITDTLTQNQQIYDEVIKGKNPDQRNMYKRFFQAVRSNKETGDNLGEELLAICLHILSYLPGEEDGKFCVITDDKEAAGKIDTLFKTTSRQHRGNKIYIFSTPKLVQFLNREQILLEADHIRSILKTGTDGNIVVLGSLISDLRSREISIDCDELTNLIISPNGINIIF